MRWRVTPRYYATLPLRYADISVCYYDYNSSLMLICYADATIYMLLMRVDTLAYDAACLYAGH